MASAAIATAAGFAPALAQPAPAPAPTAATPPVERVTVTGSRIPQKGLTSVSPVATITNTDLKINNTSSVETLLNEMPQVVANQGGEVANGSSGTATVDLRGLGPKRTLVLVNGKRLQPANIAAPTADLNTIPAAMVERVEILTGGASAVYGADAVAGVVNFIFRKNFEGLEMGGSYQINDHDNDDEGLRQINLDANFTLPDKHVNDGRVATLWGIMGANTSDGLGNVTAYIQYRNAEALLQSERDYSTCAIGTDLGSQTHFCLGSSNGPTGRFTVLGDDTPVRFTANSGAPGTMRPFSAAIDTFNFNPTNYLQRPDDRYVLGFQGHYQLAEDLDVYSEASFMDDRTIAQIAASGFFAGSGPVGGRFAVNCDNPLLDTGATEGGTTQVTPFNALCGSQLSAPLGTDGTATVDIGRRFVETNLGRQDDFKSTSYRIVGGARGTLDLWETWDYDVYGQYATTSTPRAYLNDVSRTRAQRALLVAIDDRPGSPTFGQPVCTSVLDGSDTACVPANIFSFGELTAESIAYMSATGIQQTTTEEQIVNASFNGELGFGIPWAVDAVSAAVGGEYRYTSLIHRSDDVFRAGDLLGQGGATPDVTGHYDIWEAFGEVQIPIVQDQDWVKLLELNGGYRISDYDTATGITHTYKYAGSYMPTEDVRFRASFQHAVRAPNVIELFTPPTQGLFGGTDPCSLTSSSIAGTNFYNATQCANTGLNAAQFAAFTSSAAFQCPAAQCSGPFAGNPNLKPESSDTVSFGAVFTPTFFKGFNLTVDYYDIEIEDQITIISPVAILGNCAQTANPFACSLINRDPLTGSIFNSTTLGVGVDNTTRNAGTQKASGIDVESNYRIDFDDWDWNDAGSFSLSFIGSYLEELETTYGPGFDPFDCAGFYGLVCGNPTPEWRHRLRGTWAPPWDVSFSLSWRYIDPVSLDVNSTSSTVFTFPFNGPLGNIVDGELPAMDYFDLAMDWSVSDNIRLIAGIKNLTDEDPPVTDSQVFGISAPPFGNANTYPVIYDAFGREVFVSVTTRF